MLTPLKSLYRLSLYQLTNNPMSYLERKLAIIKVLATNLGLIYLFMFASGLFNWTLPNWFSLVVGIGYLICIVGILYQSFSKQHANKKPIHLINRTL